MIKSTLNVLVGLVSIVGLMVIVVHLPNDWGWWTVPVAVLIGYVGGDLIGRAHDHSLGDD